MNIKITRETKIGVFAALCLFAMFWGVNFLKGKNIFSSSNLYYAVFTSIDGLENTNDVLINGFKVGLVKNIEFHDVRSGKFLVTLMIGKKYEIPRKTVAKLISSDIMGSKAIKLEVSPGTDYYHPGDTLPTAIELGLIHQLSGQMVPVKEKAESLMVGLENSLRVFNEVFNEQNREQLTEGIANLNRTLYSVSRSAAAIDTMLNSPGGPLRNTIANAEAISSNLRKSNRELTSIIKNFAAASDSLAKVNIVQTMSKLDTATRALSSILLKISSGEGSLGSLVHNDTLYRNLQSASKNLDLLLKDMKSNPKRYVNFSIIDLSRPRHVKEKEE